MNVEYDKLLVASFICKLDKYPSFQLNFGENYNIRIKRGDDVMKGLVEDVGLNVKTFKYSG